MKATYDMTMADAERVLNDKRDRHLSADGKWRSFPKVPNLLQYVIAGTYYARCKVNGKPVRASLDTDVFSVAKQRLPDKIKVLRKPKVEVGAFADGRLQFEQQTRCDHTLAELSKVYRLRCVERLLRSWPGLDGRKADSVTEDECRQWAQRHAEKYSPQFFNNTLNVFRQILALAGLGRDANPVFKIKRLGVRSKPLELPTTEQFERLLKEIETSGAGQAKDCADLVSFLSFTGCHIAEMKQALWRDVDWDRNEITVHSVKRRATSNASLTRVIPLIPALRQLLEKMREKHLPQPDDRTCRVSECQKSLTRACRIVGCARLTHHSLRHLFATRCVESGIDIPTVARWLGHSDGGMLAFKIYGHLRREHSQSMAAKVTFGTASATAASIGWGHER
jgi:integrase